jgi:hypothetical protein
MHKDPYVRPLLQAFICQFAWVFFCGLCVLDMGVSLRACCYASEGFWLGVILILVRRPRNPTRGDLLYIRWGLVPIVLVAHPLFMLVWKLKGAI